MPVVYVRKGEPIEKAIKRMTKIITKEGILRSVKERRFYTKPSEVRRKDRKRAVKLARKFSQSS